MTAFLGIDSWSEVVSEVFDLKGELCFDSAVWVVGMSCVHKTLRGFDIS